GPFVAHPQTPFARESNGNVDRVLRAYALMRILNPMANIPSTSAMESACPGGRMRGLQVGANVIMPSFTPKRVKELYNIYPGKNVQQDFDEDGLQAALSMIEKAGYHVSWARGDSPLKSNEKCIIENIKL
ncbi:MAG: [FeFe] hydrogenase H-cluster radical SAM maturase HydE, partial [Candidatus Marinimicrobia bacterium]|nr:[FeFe] hydrogenase H-cluster radical SAM maturase HydE [Candidatus Neomarinimicrobiota bacterium]